MASLDAAFGTSNKIKSHFRKIGQVFDERTNEDVFYIEYRVRGSGDLRTALESRKRKLDLIRQINHQAK